MCTNPPGVQVTNGYSLCRLAVGPSMAPNGQGGSDSQHCYMPKPLSGTEASRLSLYNRSDCWIGRCTSTEMTCWCTSYLYLRKRFPAGASPFWCRPAWCLSEWCRLRPDLDARRRFALLLNICIMGSIFHWMALTSFKTSSVLIMSFDCLFLIDLWLPIKNYIYVLMDIF